MAIQQTTKPETKKAKYETPNPGGANCPRCGKRAPVTSAPALEGKVRIRCHHCVECGMPFQSIEEL